MLLLPLVAFFRSRGDPEHIRNEKTILLAFSALFFGFAFFSSVLRIRYIAPIIPPLVVLSLFGLKNIVEFIKGLRTPAARRIGLIFAVAMIVLPLAINAYYILEQYRHVKPFSYLSGTVSRDEYIAGYRFEYPAMQYINKHLPSNSLLLFIFMGQRGYYCDRKYVFDMHGHKSTLRQLVKKSDTPGNILLGLKDMGITHMLINNAIFDRWLKMNFTHNDLELLQVFFKNYVTLLFFKKGYGVFRLEYASP